MRHHCRVVGGMLGAILFAGIPVQAQLLLVDGFETGGVCNGWSFFVGFEGDANCASAGWDAHLWFAPISWSTCAPLRIYGLVHGDRLLFTTCSPTGVGAVGDPLVNAISDDLGNQYAFALNDDCLLATQVPQLFEWSCRNINGFQRMFCVPQDGAGLQFLGNSWIQLSICGFNGEPGSSSFYVWENGTSAPNPG